MFSKTSLGVLDMQVWIPFLRDLRGAEHHSLMFLILKSSGFYAAGSKHFFQTRIRAMLAYLETAVQPFEKTIEKSKANCHIGKARQGHKREYHEPISRRNGEMRPDV